MPVVKVREINLYYEIHGTGEPLLLIHGLGLDSGAWIGQVLALSSTYQVITFDNRGCGRTDAPGFPYSTEIMAEDTIALLDALEIDRCHVLGFSMGGLIAQVLTIKYPERVQSLILASTAAKLPAISRQVIQAWAQLLKEKIRPGMRVKVQLPWLFTNQFLQSDAIVDELINLSLRYPYQPTVSGFTGQVAACVTHDSLEQLSQIVLPTLILAGQEDILIPVKASQEMMLNLPNATLQIIDHASHNFFWEMPDQFNRAVLDFVVNY